MSRRRHALVDGYNLLCRLEGKCNRRGGGAAARHRLVRRIEHAVGTIVDRMTIVFDGLDARDEEVWPHSIVRVVFARPPLSADLWIEREVRAALDPSSLLVISSDRMIRQSAEAAGAETMGCSEFLELCGSAGQSRQRAFKSLSFERRLEDLFPP